MSNFLVEFANADGSISKLTICAPDEGSAWFAAQADGRALFSLAKILY